MFNVKIAIYVLQSCAFILDIHQFSRLAAHFSLKLIQNSRANIGIFL